MRREENNINNCSCGRVLFWTCILTILVLPWFLATIFVWIYAEGYERQSGSEGDPAPGYVTAILQTSSSLVYIVFTYGALVCIGVVGRPHDNCSYFCLVLGIPVFFVVPVTSGILVLISAINHEESTERNVGIATTVLCFFSTFPCCCVLICALACGTRGKGRRSRYPLPIAYVPVLGEWEQREDKWEKKKSQREFTDDYPADSPPGPIPSYKAKRTKAAKSSNDKSSRKSSFNSGQYFRDIGPEESRSSVSVTAGVTRGKSTVASLSTITEDSCSAMQEDGRKAAKSVSKKDKSQRKFSLTALLITQRKSTVTSLETPGSTSADSCHRGHSEPAVKAGTTTEKGQTVTTLTAPKPNSRIDSVADPSGNTARNALTDRKAISANGGSRVQ